MVNPVSSSTPGEIPLQNQVPSNKSQLVPTTLLPPDFAVEDPQTPVQCPGFDPGVDINTPTADYGDLVEVAYRQLTKDNLVEPVLLADLVEHSRLLHIEHPKQKDIEAILKVINQKILRQVHLPTSFRDMHGAYLNSPHFQDIYLYLLQNKLPRNSRKWTQVSSAATEYMLLDFLLFKIVKDRDTQEYKPLLCLPTSEVDMLLDYFHSSIMGGHMGITKTYLTISQRFFCPNLAHHVCGIYHRLPCLSVGKSRQISQEAFSKENKHQYACPE